jgi:hypothetical protein
VLEGNPPLRVPCARADDVFRFGLNYRFGAAPAVAKY